MMYLSLLVVFLPMLSGERRFRQKRQAQEDKLTHNDIETFVRGHNDFRTKVSPSASNMPFLAWNETWATQAQSWASLCPLTTDPALDTQQVKQNICYLIGFSYNVEDCLAQWNNDMDFLLYDKECKLGHRHCDDYMQMIWAYTAQFGCGVSFCNQLREPTTTTAAPTAPTHPRHMSFRDRPSSPSLSTPPPANSDTPPASWFETADTHGNIGNDSYFAFPSGRFSAYVLVCNYFVEGNKPGVYPYLAGEPCSLCPSGFTGCAENLCRRSTPCSHMHCGNNELADEETCLCSESYYRQRDSLFGNAAAPRGCVWLYLSVMLVTISFMDP